MAIQPVSASSLFAPLESGGGAGGGLSGLFGLKPAEAPSVPRLVLGGPTEGDASGAGGGADLVDLYKNLASLGSATQQNLLARLGAVDPTQPNGLASLFSGGGTGGGTGGGVLGSLFGPSQPVAGASTAAADILGAFFQPQFDLLGDVINALG
ncbi:MAG: hypothetical protein JNK35_09360 [Phycisphaerae bacterium]|nr:hypothetical protein [Phycisphaerae bacterium]